MKEHHALSPFFKLTHTCHKALGIGSHYNCLFNSVMQYIHLIKNSNVNSFSVLFQKSHTNKVKKRFIACLICRRKVNFQSHKPGSVTLLIAIPCKDLVFQRVICRFTHFFIVCCFSIMHAVLLNRIYQTWGNIYCMV